MTHPEEEVKIVQGAETLWPMLQSALSVERLSTYVAACDGDRTAALHLYTWNTAVSAALYGPLQTLEVAFRNAAHDALSSAYGDTWFETTGPGLDYLANNQISLVRKSLEDRGCATKPPDIVARLSFGFWVGLLGPGGRRAESTTKANYEMTIWRPALRHAFPFASPLNRRAAHAPLDRMRQLRNRIAHHEPVFARRLDDDFKQLLEVLGWISPLMSEWVSESSRFPELFLVDRKNTAVRF